MRDGASFAPMLISNENFVGQIPCAMSGATVLKIGFVIEPVELSMASTHDWTMKLCIVGCGLEGRGGLDLG